MPNYKQSLHSRRLAAERQRRFRARKQAKLIAENPQMMSLVLRVKKNLAAEVRAAGGPGQYWKRKYLEMKNKYEPIGGLLGELVRQTRNFTEH